MSLITDLITFPVRTVIGELQSLNEYARSRSELEAERDFLVERLRTGIHHGEYQGLSSDAMIRQAILDEDAPDRFPLDNGDLWRCEETYKRAPEHLQKKMLPTLEEFRDFVNQRTRNG